ncbi:DUF2530 domain-containing protein [Leifsonia sp. Root112D2]|jgi:hypothetical protein|uniref:DUF2530 domain-containing protein n=1 Tax=Leifsonia sp. Root112D2 TaxID=1736426 RepID=UPI0006FE9ABD|nr:DUF2530 domain-containing protein [Leifsonia sp. Root112D2]KQV07331.1 hypothetical protein ASC63_08505 [Leifsonia sp. Root112D2]
MRLWLRDSERRPDPLPAKTDDRKAVLTGLVLWIVGLGVLALVFGDRLISDDRLWWLWTDIIGIVLGALGLIYLAIKRR